MKIRLGGGVVLIENEYKILISAEKYLELLEYLDWDGEIIQVNYYYDTDHLLLAKQDKTLRVRAFGDTLLLQMKEPMETKIEGLSKKRETEIRVAEIPLKIDSDFLHKRGFNNISDNLEFYMLGKLETRRCLKQIGDIEIALDKNDYMNIVDFEVEVEYKGDDKAARALLKELDLTPQKVSTGKRGRFLRQYML